MGLGYGEVLEATPSPKTRWEARSPEAGWWGEGSGGSKERTKLKLESDRGTSKHLSQSI